MGEYKKKPAVCNPEESPSEPHQAGTLILDFLLSEL
jgi:hypothetical protein